MSYFRIAIVGRPNVGKSSIVNMLAGRKVSIVDDTPGTTRDRVSTLIKLQPEDPAKPEITVEVMDTGGFGVYTVEGRQIDDAGMDLAALTSDIEKQIQSAVQSADLVLFVIDSQVGISPQDLEVARLLREGGLGPTARTKRKTSAALKANDKGGKKIIAKAGTPGKTKPAPAKVEEPEEESDRAPVMVVANKCDGPRWEPHAMEAAALGFGEPLIVSAMNNFRRRELNEKLHELVRKALGRRKSKAEAKIPEMMLAIVGKRNAGKSTLVNSLAGEQRVIVSEIAGTTRDAIDVRFELDGRAFVAIDTAGLRRRKSLNERIEHWALNRCQQAINRADVSLLMIDATVPISHVDQQLGRMIVAAFKPVVIVVNKWDLAAGQPIAKGSGAKGAGQRTVTTEDYESYIRKEIPGLDFAPIAFISAAKRENVKPTIDLAFDLFGQTQARTTTGKLNRMLREIISRQGPTSKIGTFAKVLYTTQIAICPPTIVCVVNRPELFTPNYQRFLMNRFREELPFPEVPIKLLIRDRKRDETIESADGTLARPADPNEGEPVEIMSDPSSYFDDDGKVSAAGKIRGAHGRAPK